MKKITFFNASSLLMLFLFLSASSVWGQDTWINEDIQDWTASPYDEDSQETIDVGEETGIVDIIQSWVRPTTTEHDNTGFVQMRSSPMSFLVLPEVPDVGQVEFNLSAFGGGRSLELQKLDGEDWVLVHTFNDIGNFLGNFTYDIDQDSPITLRLTSPSHALRVHDIIIYKFDDEPPTQVATPTFDPDVGTFYDPVDVTIETTTPDATIYYSTDSEAGPWTEYTDPVNVDETTTLWAYAEADGLDDSDVASAEYTFPLEVASIEELQDIAVIGGLYRITGEVFMTYQNDSRNQKYFQDELDGGRGIKIDDPDGHLTTDLEIGDGIENLIGTIGHFNNMIQLTPVEGQSPENTSSAGNILVPLEVTLADMIDENNIITVAGQDISVYQALLIEIEDLQFEQDGNFDSGTDFGVVPISDPTASLEDIDESDYGVLFRVEYADLDYNGDPIPQVPLTLTAIVDQRNEDARIFARDRDDFEIEDPILFASPSSLDGFTYVEGEGPSEEQQFTVSGQNLLDDITINAPDNYEISETSGSGYTDEIVLSQTAGEVAATDIFVILKDGLAIGTYEETIEITSEDADMREVSLEGEVTEPLVTEVPFETTFNVDEKWGGTGTGYQNRWYEDGGWYVYGDNAIRGTTYTFEDSDYAFRERVLFTITNLAAVEGMTGFSLQLLDWMTSPGSNRDLNISFDGGDSWETLLTINKDWFDEYQVYQEFVHYFEEAKDFEAEDFVISIGDGAENNNNRIKIGQFKALDEEPPPPPAVPDPEFDLAAGTYFEEQTVSIDNFADYEPTANIYYTLDGEDPTDGDELYDDAVGILLEDGNGPITLKAIAIDGEEESDVTTAEYVFPLNVDNLEELRQQPFDALYRVDNSSVFIGGTGFRNTKFFQDDSGFGIQIDDPGTPVIDTDYVIGDQVAELVGTLGQFQGQLQFSPALDPGAPIATGVEVEPLERTLDDLTQDDQSRLVVVYNVEFEEAGENFGGGGSTTNITDPSIDDFDGLYRNVFGDSDITGSPIPEGPVNITGIIQENNADLNLAARNLDDFDKDEGTIINENDGLEYATLQHAVDAASPGDRIRFEGDFDNLDASGSGVILAPGTSPGCAYFTGNFELSNTETLEIDINGTAACDEFDRILVDGITTLGGATLDVTLGFDPVLGDDFPIIAAYDTPVGQFDQGEEISVVKGEIIYTFAIIYDVSGVTLELTQIDDPAAIPVGKWALLIFIGLVAGYYLIISRSKLV